MVPHHLCAENDSKEKTATAQRMFYNYNWLKKLTEHETHKFSLSLFIKY